LARKLFGTDGIRGVAGEVLTAELALALGRAASEELRSDHAQRIASILRDLGWELKRTGRIRFWKRVG